jgi:hypothetical protein
LYEYSPPPSPARSMLPASQLSGLSGSGLHSSARMARHTECSVHAGLHAVAAREDPLVRKQRLDTGFSLHRFKGG